jgi:hypothetical protein
VYKFANDVLGAAMVPSSVVIGWSVNERQIGMPPYTEVEWVWAESAVGSRGLAKVVRRATGPTRVWLMQCSRGGNWRMS